MSRTLKFNRETHLGQMPACKQGFYLADNGEVIMLFHKDSAWYVVSFDKDGFCNNASSYEAKKEAWRLFVNIVQDDLDGKNASPSPQEEVSPMQTVAEVASPI